MVSCGNKEKPSRNQGRAGKRVSLAACLECLSKTGQKTLAEAGLFIGVDFAVELMKIGCKSRRCELEIVPVEGGFGGGPTLAKGIHDRQHLFF